MSLSEEIDIQIKAIESDDRYKSYLVAPTKVEINAPLALQQLSFVTEIRTLQGVKSNLTDPDLTQEVKTLCEKLGLSDWTKKGEEGSVSVDDARIILDIINTKNMDIPILEFRKALIVELEHGMKHPDANVTNNHPLMTGKIALAHFKESIDYYLRLEISEIEAGMVACKDLLVAQLALIQFSMRNLET